MAEKIIITFPNKGNKEYEKGMTLSEMAEDNKSMCKYKIVGAIVNNELRELWYKIEKSCTVQFIDMSSLNGNRFYSRSLSFLFIIAAKEVFPDCQVRIEHSISKGLYCEVNKGSELTKEDVEKIDSKMRELVALDIPIKKDLLSMDEARELFAKTNQQDKIDLLKHIGKDYMNVYSCYGYYNYFYGYMMPSTGSLKTFELKFYPPGLILRFPEKNDPESLPVFNEQKKLFNIFREFEKWGEILELYNVGQLNNSIHTGRILELIGTAEGLQEKKLAQIADMIANSQDKKKLILIAGPSSSGKTTFAQRLSVQLRVDGLKPIAISLDDFFKNREDTPITEDGEYDFETIDAIDVVTFNDVLSRLINGEEVEMPSFNFHTGQREWRGKRIKINENNIIVVEGIHGLNEKLTNLIPKEQKFKIYISPLTHLSIDDHNRIPTSDLRLIRRIVRDYQFRSAPALKTIKMWDSVRRGEDIYIYPFQEDADVMFNSSLVYELCILKKIALPLLQEIDNRAPEYIEVKRLKTFLNYFLEVDTDEVPINSILREFIGKSCYFEK